jgi:hypothetical protein
MPKAGSPEIKKKNDNRKAQHPLAVVAALSALGSPLPWHLCLVGLLRISSPLLDANMLPPKKAHT